MNLQKLLLSLFLLAGIPMTGFGTQVRLVDRIGVDAPPITLGKVASIEGGSDEDRRIIANLEVADMPSVGRTRVVSAFRIKNLLQKAGFDGVPVKGMQSTLFVQTRMVPELELKTLVKEWVESHLSPHQECNIEYLSLPRQWQVPAGESIELSVDSRSEPSGGNHNLSLRAQAGDQILATTHARIDVKLFQDMAVLTKPLPRKTPLTSEHVKIQKAEITKATGMEVLQASDLIGMVSKRDLPAGSLLSANDFERPILISRGMPTRVIVVNENIRMGIAGAEALQDGRKGDTILLRNPMNPKENLRATVMREGVALIKIR